MIISERFKKLLGKDKSQEELEKHYDSIELEKGDFSAMVIAAIITFLPVLLIAMAAVYGLVWVLFAR